MDKTICELFAGVGGLAGFERLNSGWNTTWFHNVEPGAKPSGHMIVMCHILAILKMQGRVSYWRRYKPYEQKSILIAAF